MQMEANSRKWLPDHSQYPERNPSTLPLVPPSFISTLLKTKNDIARANPSPLNSKAGKRLLKKMQPMMKQGLASHDSPERQKFIQPNSNATIPNEPIELVPFTVYASCINEHRNTAIAEKYKIRENTIFIMGCRYYSAINLIVNAFDNLPFNGSFPFSMT